LGAMPTCRTRGYMLSLAAPLINRGHPQDSSVCGEASLAFS